MVCLTTKRVCWQVHHCGDGGHPFTTVQGVLRGSLRSGNSGELGANLKLWLWPTWLEGFAQVFLDDHCSPLHDFHVMPLREPHRWMSSMGGQRGILEAGAVSELNWRWSTHTRTIAHRRINKITQGSRSERHHFNQRVQRSKLRFLLRPTGRRSRRVWHGIRDSAYTPRGPHPRGVYTSGPAPPGRLSSGATGWKNYVTAISLTWGTRDPLGRLG